MKKVIQQYVAARKNLFSYFGCADDYPAKVFANAEWSLTENEGMFFLTYTEGGETQSCAVVKKDGGPLVYNTKDYSMIIAIDCIKTAFIFKNNAE